jgi:hypothetical protein
MLADIMTVKSEKRDKCRMRQEGDDSFNLRDRQYAFCYDAPAWPDFKDSRYRLTAALASRYKMCRAISKHFGQPVDFKCSTKLSSSPVTIVLRLGGRGHILPTYLK